MTNHSSPPPTARWLLRLLFPGDVRESRANELDAAYDSMARDRGRFRANWWYRWQTLMILVHSLRIALPAAGVLIRRNVSLALRQLRNNRGYALLNVVGLALGLAAFMIIVLFARQELSWDLFHQDADRIYRINRHVIEAGTERAHHAETQGMLGATVRSDFPEVDAVVRIDAVRREFLRYADRTLRSDSGFIADSTFFELFDFPLANGRAGDVLDAPFSVVLTQSTAARLFGEEDPVGRQVDFGADAVPLTVTGVAKDPPENSHLQFDYVISWTSVEHPLLSERYANLTNWVTLTLGTYVRLSPDADPGRVEARFDSVMRDHLPDRLHRYEFYLQPLADVHLSGSNVVATLDPVPGNRTLVNVLLLVAVLVLLIAIINFVNLATARAEARALEVGVRKAVGAARGQLMLQFVGESLVMSSSATFLALTIVAATVPTLSNLVGRDLMPEIAALPEALGFLALVVLVSGLAAGFYPAIILSAFRPSETLRRITTGSSSRGWLRRILVVTQYAASLILLIGTLIVYRQMDFMQSKELGYEAEQLVHIPMNERMVERFDAFREELLRSPSILNVTHATGGATIGAWGMDYQPEGASTDEFINFRTLGVDRTYFDTYGIDVLQGPDPEILFDGSETQVYINETLRDELLGRWGLPDVIGRRIVVGSRDQEMTVVVGVVEDFHLRSVSQSIPPLLIFGTETGWLATTRIDADRTDDAVNHMASVWSRFEDRQPFESIFVDDAFRRYYESERRLMRILGVFAGLAVVVATLGLFGLTAYLAEQRRREIGIRKVLGATSRDIVLMLSRSFMALVVMAVIIATPIGILAARWWLEDFPYRASISPSIFLLAGSVLLLAALATIGWQAVRAARANPVDNLTS